MTIRLNPYLNFRGDAREAMEFYQSVFGGDLRVGTFADFQSAQDPSENDLVMHAQLNIGDGLTLMGSDTPERMALTVGDSISVSLSGDDEATLTRWFEGLAVGGEITEPLVKAPWGDSFGMLRDRFGVNWLVNIEQSGA